MDSPLASEFARIPTGNVRAWFSLDVGETIANLSSSLEAEPGNPLLVVSWRDGHDVGKHVQDTLESLAHLALGYWPDWYGRTGLFPTPALGSALVAAEDARVISQIGRDFPAIDSNWARKAAQMCRRAKRPIFQQVPSQVQLRQLMTAIIPRNLTLVLALEEKQADPERLLCFARACTWIASETGAPVAAVLPLAHRAAPEVDAISYDATLLAPDVLGPVGSKEAPESSPNAQPRISCAPILGRPHPASAGEQLLAQWLARDAELAPLFEFNQRISVPLGESFIVDLLWRNGKFVVEVDGYTWHSSRQMFASDRHRDYRLSCEGFRTLRLPHEEVLDDPALQCEKIRNMVHMIRRGE